MQLVSGHVCAACPPPPSGDQRTANVLVNRALPNRASIFKFPLGRSSACRGAQKGVKFRAVQTTTLPDKQTKSQDTLAVPEHWKEHIAKLGSGKQQALQGYFRLVKQINGQEVHLQKLSDEQLKAKTAEFKHRLSKGASLDDLLVEAFALVREVSSRVLRMRHFDAQMVGGIVLHKANIAEMKTGEGKTLVATLPAYLNALTGKGVHVITVNDYLAERDANWMGKIYRFLGLSVAVVKSTDPPLGRGRLFKCDIVYVTAQSLCFTYLQDNTAIYKESVAIRRPFNYAIVDEVDSLLIDEGRNPMLINLKVELPEDRFKVAMEVVKGLVEGERDQITGRPRGSGDFILDKVHKGAWFTDKGLTTVFATLMQKGEITLGKDETVKTAIVRLWQDTNPWGPYLLNAVKAEHLYLRDKDYIVTKQNEVKIINIVTGRVMPISRWQDNIHQSVEAKEGVPLQGDSMTQASVTYQCFFNYYDKLAGMTGTAITEAREFYEVYGLNVVEVPSRLPNIRIDHAPRLFTHRIDRLVSLYLIVMEAHQKGRPVLIGTASVAESEQIDILLQEPLHFLTTTDNMTGMQARKGLTSDKNFLVNMHQCTLNKGWSPFRGPRNASKQELYVSETNVKMLNAKPENVRKESQIVAQAGLPKAVTIATNMAGRGTDIVLGGNPRGLAAHILLKFIARRLLTDKALEEHIRELDDVPLDGVDWPFNEMSADMAQDEELSKMGLNVWELFEEDAQLPADVMDMMKNADLVCTVRPRNMELEEAQHAIAKVLDRTEAVLAQVVSEHWAGGAFDVQSHADSALTKFDSLIDNDSIPQLQRTLEEAAADKKQEQKAPKPELTVTYQKPLVKAAGHLLLYLEQQCEEYAKRVKQAGGLLVIGTNLQDSRRSENQLSGRAARQGDPGESLMMYDMEDGILQHNPTTQLTRKALARAYELDKYGQPYLEGLLANQYLQSIYRSLESHSRASRAEVRKYDEVMETFRRHVYSLRRLILSGTAEQNNDVLRRYFQDQADGWVDQIVNTNKSPRHWDWDALRKQVNLLFPEPADLTKAKAKPQLTVTLPDGTTHTPPQAASTADQSSQNPFTNHVLPLDSTQALSQQPAQTGSSRGPHSGQASTSAATQAVGMNGSEHSSGTRFAPSQHQQQPHTQLQQATPFANSGHSKSMQSSSNGSGPHTQQPQRQQQQLPIVSYDGIGVSSPAEWQAAWDSKLQPAQTSQAQTQGSLRGLHDDADGHQQSASPSSDAQADAEPGRLPHQHSAHSAAEASSSSLSPAGVALAQQMAASNPDATQKLMEFSLQWLNNHADSLHQEEVRTGRPAEHPGGSPGHPVTQMHGMPSVDAAGTVIGTGTAKAPEEASTMHVEELTEDDTRELMQALMAGQALYAPRPGKLDLQYKAKVAEHRKMLKDFDRNSGVRPRLNGWYATHAEQLRNWLGEWLLAKYEQKQQLYRKRSVDAERSMMLATLDDIWMHFLRDMAGLQAGVPLRSFSRMDPEQEFRLDASAAFIDVLTTFKQECVYNALKPPSLISVTADQFKQITDLPGEAFYLETASDGSYSLKQVQPNTSSTPSDTGAHHMPAGATNDNSSEPKGKPAGAAHVSLNGSTVAESQTGSPSQHTKANGSSALGDADRDVSDGSLRQQDLANV